MSVVRYEPDPDRHIAVVTIDRPEARNAVNQEVAEQIEAALDDVEARDDLWVTILTGTPPVFCSGADLKVVAAGGVKTLWTKKGGFAGLIRRERTKPLIAAVDGPALAGGTEITLVCDLVVASRTATFGIPEVQRSLVAAGGGLFRLGRRIPYVVAMEWALTGDAYPAARAAELGLVNEVTAEGKALDGAIALAERITKNAPRAVQLSRWVMHEGTTADDARGWELSREAGKIVSGTEDFREGLTAFAEKRPPRWTGR
ncbi:crotonase/enoyl-CoA hydratase family protein [Pseudonocardia endophytica]|uniref:Enoyl-CoA hydratase n=1 Tax=Pseudonocardia endophytica TaxID=401976 RepID=A0A4R1HWR5_PSEEN|nr:crotonase/enoyl-CoA hydratase family protein [Pseudonocardia endophytica]TCK21982.1 enoyl-CoA hydratase [Pseudonocardia endophytica]